MRRRNRLGWVLLAAFALAASPVAAHAQSKKKATAAEAQAAEDKSLEDRVRALEKKVDSHQKADATEEKTMLGRVEAMEKDVKDTKQSIEEKLGVEFHGLVATNYNYNFNSPDSQANRIHVFDEDANTFQLDQANINIQRNKPEGFGFDLDVDFGKTAEVVGRATRWSNNPNSTESTNSVELRQAYVKYAFPETPFSITAGKFVTPHGAEVIKAYNNFNYSISNSILFGFAIPFTHTGAFATYTFPETLGSLQLGVINGWDDVSDNNSGKSFQGVFSLTPHPMFSFFLPVTYGAEQPNNGRSKRFLITPLITVKPIDELTFIFDYDYGNESNIALSGASTLGPCDANNACSIVGAPGNAMWQGAAAYVVWAATDRVQLALRGEVFDDPDGVRTGYEQAGFGPGATFWEVTPSVAFKIVDGLFWRAEYRHDESDKRYFDRDTGVQVTRGQDLIATELIYGF